MTEQQWHGSDDPGAMLNFLGRRPGARKLRLFAAACARRGAASLPDAGVSAAAALAERLADGAATEAERAAALTSARRDRSAGSLARTVLLGEADMLVASPGQGAPQPAPPGSGAYYAALMTAERLTAGEGADGSARAWAAAVLRCLMGDPWRSAPLASPDVLRWNDGLVPRMAREVYDRGLWGDLPLLADALLDAGYGDEGLLAHCRSAGPHARGCHAVDTILGLGGMP
jgi:hypothetical protein